jgi:hypothetical protein
VEIRCEQCREPVPADDINLDTVLAKCRNCNSVFDFSRQVGRSNPTAAKVRRDKGEIPLPAGLRVDDDGRTLTIVKPWSRTLGCFFLVFAALWNGITWTGLVLGFSSQEPWTTRLFMVPFILVGLATAYSALVGLLNRTVIRVDQERLTVTMAPIPSFGNRRFDVGALDQLWVTEYVAYQQNNVPQYRFSVEALLKDGTKKRLMGGLEVADQALYLEGLLEKRLGIVDRPMEGEI